MLMKNKKADTSILILVVLTIVLFAAILFTFDAAENKLKIRMKGLSIVDNLRIEEEIFILNLKTISEEIVEANPGISEQKFIEEFKKKYIPLIDKDDIFKERQINDEDFDISIENKVLKFRLKDIIFRRSSRDNKFDIKHTKDVYFEIGF